MNFDPKIFEERENAPQLQRNGDTRNEYQRDRARIMHSAAFRRLQGKTQVMGIGEGDFHRTRLTHSIEVAQIGYGILEFLKENEKLEDDVRAWLPERDLIEAACFAHDLGHPPFGHRGELALHKSMWEHGGFEGNGQTLRILTKLEKYQERGRGIYPTRRLVLGVLKYPKAMNEFKSPGFGEKPPKCYLDDEAEIVEWALSVFPPDDQMALVDSADGETSHHSLDCSILELADDIAYGIHDIEDIIARGLATHEEIKTEIHNAFENAGGPLTHMDCEFSPEMICKDLLGSSFDRKQMIAQLVNLFITSVSIKQHDDYEHPLLKYSAVLNKKQHNLLKALKRLAFDLIVKKAEMQQLELRGERIVKKLFEVLASNPEGLIPQSSWEDGCTNSSKERRVCDYVAGMTDNYAEKLYKRLFQPGFGSSGDEL